VKEGRNDEGEVRLFIKVAANTNLVLPLATCRLREVERTALQWLTHAKQNICFGSFRS
jgi:hypothetical protein